MAEETTSKKGKVGHRVLIGLAILGFALILTAVWWFFWPRCDMKQVKALISDFAKDSDDPQSVEKILLEGVKDIRWNRHLYLMAKDYAKATNMPIEQVLVDTAISQAKEWNYIAE